MSCLNEQSGQLSESKLQMIQEENNLKDKVAKANNERDSIQRKTNKNMSLIM